MPTRIISITLEEKLVEKIDELRGLIPRSKYIAVLLQEALKDK